MIYVTGSRIARTSDLKILRRSFPLRRKTWRSPGTRTCSSCSRSSRSWAPARSRPAAITRTRRLTARRASACVAWVRTRPWCSSMAAASRSVRSPRTSRPTSSTSIRFPVAAIERLEVLKDGASAVYGADAVAGVVNVIMRKNFDGVEISAGYGATTESGMDETTLSGIWGFEWRGLEHHDDPRLFQEQHAREQGARLLRHGQPDTAWWRRFPLLARLPGPFHRDRAGSLRPTRTARRPRSTPPVRRTASRDRLACTTLVRGTCWHRKPSARG